jgi:hypothetical protein
MRLTLATIAVLAFGTILSATPGPGALALLCAESGSTCNGALAQFQATGKFSSVDVFNTYTATPALSDISGYGAVMAWTDSAPADPVGLGNLLASYYALGGKRLTIATYSFSTSWAITGTVMGGSYAALTNMGVTGDVSGNLVATIPDPIFTGITLSSVQFFHNNSYAHPALAPGATLLATDGAGVNEIARSANGVINVDLYPGYDAPANAAFYSLLAATLLGGTAALPVPVLSPVAGLILMAGIVAVALYSLRRRAV